MITKIILPDITLIREKEKIFNDSLIAAKDDELYIEMEKAIKKRCNILNKGTGYPVGIFFLSSLCIALVIASIIIALTEKCMNTLVVGMIISSIACILITLGYLYAYKRYRNIVNSTTEIINDNSHKLNEKYSTSEFKVWFFSDGFWNGHRNSDQVHVKVKQSILYPLYKPLDDIEWELNKLNQYVHKNVSYKIDAKLHKDSVTVHIFLNDCECDVVKIYCGSLEQFDKLTKNVSAGILDFTYLVNEDL